MISDSRRVLFVHVQKTGGSTVDRVMKEAFPDGRDHPPRRHAPLFRILNMWPELSDYFAFGFVRNPWARMVSWHTMIMHFKVNAAEGVPWAVQRMEENPFLPDIAENYADFDSFIIKAPEKWPRLARPQIDYLRTPEREADFIGRTENLADDLREIFRRLDMPVPESVPVWNKSPHTDYRDYYNRKTRKQIATRFADDIVAFDYEF